jgi:MSHA biogenesis protein MshN
MSVLNKMLRDLELRQHTAVTTAPAAQLAYRPDRPLWLNILLLLSFCLLCFAVYAILTRDVTTDSPVAVPALLQPVAATDVVEIAQSLTAETVVTAPADGSAPGSAEATNTAGAENIANAANTEKTESTENTVELPVAGPRPQASQPALALNEVQATAAKVAAPAGKMKIEHAAEPVAQRKAALRQQALGSAQAGQLQQALQYWQQLQLLTPQDAELYLAQAGLWLQLGQPAQAHAVLQQAVAQGIVHADIQLMLAQHAAAAQQWQAVDALLPPQFTLAQQPDYYGMKATALQQLGQHQAALHWFSQLVVLQPQQGRWWLGAAISFDAQAERAQAQHYYRQAWQHSEALSVASRNYIQQRLAATE